MKKIKKLFFLFISGLLLSVPNFLLAQGWNVGSVTRYGLPERSLSGPWGIINAVMLWLLGLVGTIGIIGFAISGILYMTATGMKIKCKMQKERWCIQLSE